MVSVSEWRDVFRLYMRRDIWLVGILGFSSGVPLLLTLSVLGYWLKTLGVDKTSIGLFALVGVPYNLKFLWAPLIDRLSLPYLTVRFGRRRSWAWVSQGGLIVCIVLLGFTDPSVEIYRAALLAVAIAFFSATQDIVLDALRIELLDSRSQGGGAASFIGGYRLAMLSVGGGALVLSDYVSWSIVFIVLSLGLLVGALGVALAREPSFMVCKAAGAGDFLRQALWEPLREFLSRRHAVLILVFIVLYKYGDAFGGVMANPFYIELGFSGTQIGVITKVWGLAATLAGVFLGGLLVVRYDILPALLIGGVLQALTNGAFIALAYSGGSIFLLGLAISADNLTGGIGTAALVAYLSGLCMRSHTATQYALLSSLSASGRTFLSAGAGAVAEAMSWASFFWLTMVLAVPALLIGWFLYVRSVERTQD